MISNDFKKENLICVPKILIPISTIMEVLVDLRYKPYVKESFRGVSHFFLLC